MSVIQGNAKQGSTRGFYPKTIEGSLRFNDDDTARLQWTPDSAGNRKTWTLSMWVKRGNLGIEAPLWYGSPSGTYDEVRFETNDTLNIYSYNGSYQWRLATTQVFRDPSAWYHFVVALDTTVPEVKFYVNGEQVTAFSTNTQPSSNYEGGTNNAAGHGIGMRSDGTGNEFDGYLAEVHFTDGTAYDADAFGEFKNGVWVAKTPEVTYGTNGFHLTFQDDVEVEAFNTVLYRGSGSNQTITGVGFAPDLVWIKRRDGAGDHIVHDSIRGNDGRNRLFPNSTNAESTNGDGFNHLESDGFSLDNTGSGGDHNYSGRTYVAWCWDAGANNAVTGHSSVTYTGSGAAQKISGFGFSPDLVLFKIRNSTDYFRAVDTVRGAGKSLNFTTNSEYTASNEFVGFDKDGVNIGSNAGWINWSPYNYIAYGWDAGDGDPVSNTDGDITSTVKASTTNGFSIVSYSGVAATDGSTNGGNPWGIGHGLSSAPDFVIYKQRTSTNPWIVYHSAVGATKYLALNTTAAEATELTTFRDTAPTNSVLNVGGWDTVNRTGNDYIAYCWHDVTGKQKFDTYTGTGASGNTVTTGFRPGFLMIKRTDSTSNWMIVDASRSPFNEADTALFANATSTDQDLSAYGMFEFTDTGFVVNDNGTLSGTTSTNINNATYIYAAFAGSYSDYITDYNTDGSIDSRVKANDTTGFSIVSYTGNGSSSQSFGHGLSSAPDWVIIKDRSEGVQSWTVWHTSLGTSKYLNLNNTNAVATDSNRFPSDPSTSVVNIGSSQATNKSSNNYIAYCWAEKSGYSKFGSYAGNATSVDLGFNPAFILIKRITGTAKDWWVFDNTREVDGQFGNYLSPNQSYSEQTVASAISVSGNTITFPNNWDSSHDGSASSTYIYAAFADTREAAFWLDQSGNDNDWQPVNLDHNDTVSDSPTDNHATFSPLVLAKSGTTNFRTLGVFSDGNLTCTTNADNESGTIPFGATSGQYYVEFNIDNLAQRLQIIVYTDELYVHQNAITTSSDGGGNATDRVSWTTGDVIGIAIDMDNNKVFFHKNGDYFGTSNPSTNTGGDTLNSFTGLGFRQDSGSTGNAQISFNAGQQPFKYDPPA